MKKLLYTLFAFALIVACDKDMDDNYDSSSINPIEAEVEISAETLSIVDALVSRLENGLPSDKGVKGTSGFTARTGDACADDTRSLTGYTNYLSYEIFIDGGNNYGLIRSEENLPISDQISPFLTIWLAQDGTGNNFDVVVNGAVVSSGTSAGLIGLFAAPELVAMENLNAAFVYTGVGDVTIASCTAATGGSTEVWAPSADGLTWTHPTHGSYTLSAAPFPLTGILATTSESHSANYAGTGDISDQSTWTAVNTAIRGDLETR